MQKEYEGYISLEFNDSKICNNLLINYQIYEKYWIRNNLKGIVPSIDHNFLEYFESFEFYLMQKEPTKLAIEMSRDNFIVKLWFVCELKDKYATEDIIQNKKLIKSQIDEQLLPKIVQDYKCDPWLVCLETCETKKTD